MHPTGLTARDSHRRSSDAIAPKPELERPLAFMSPGERVRLYLREIEPMTTVLGRLYEESASRVTTIASCEGLIDAERVPLIGDRALLEAELIEAIKRTRAKILGGVGS